MGMNVREALSRHIRSLSLSPLDRTTLDTDCFVIDHRTWVVQGPYPEDMAKEYASMWNRLVSPRSDAWFYVHRADGERISK